MLVGGRIPTKTALAREERGYVGRTLSAGASVSDPTAGGAAPTTAGGTATATGGGGAGSDNLFEEVASIVERSLTRREQAVVARQPHQHRACSS